MTFRRTVAGGLLVLLLSAWSTDQVVSYSPSSWGIKTTYRSPMRMNENAPKDSFSFANLFGKSAGTTAATSSAASAAATATSLRSNKSLLQPHPSVRPHISPLNRLHPDAKNLVPTTPDALPMHPQVRSGVLPNGLSYVILPNKSPPGRFEAHLQVFSGSGTFHLIVLTACLMAFTDTYSFTTSQPMSWNLSRVLHI